MIIKVDGERLDVPGFSQLDNLMLPVEAIGEALEEDLWNEIKKQASVEDRSQIRTIDNRRYIPLSELEEFVSNKGYDLISILKKIYLISSAARIKPAPVLRERGPLGTLQAGLVRHPQLQTSPVQARHREFQ